jgi:hypothetical protein
MRRPWTPAPWWGAAADSLVGKTTAGQMPVEAIPGANGEPVQIVALAPVIVGGKWVGAAGYNVPVDSQEVAMLGALTRSDVVVSADSTADGHVTSTLDSATAYALRAAVRPWIEARDTLSDSLGTRAVREVTAGARRYFVVLGALPGAAGAGGRSSRSCRRYAS